MRDWEEVEKDIQNLDSTHQGILKCRGTQRRRIVSNDGQTIYMRTGVKTDREKFITYEMIKYAYDLLRAGCIFDSTYFCIRYQKKNTNTDCRYSMVGGILVELKLADRHPIFKKSCYYTPGKGLY